MTAPKYSDWIAHNATPDSTCPPDAVGKRVQVQCAEEIRRDAERDPPKPSDKWHWGTVGVLDEIIAYRILIEPVPGERMFWAYEHSWRDWDMGHASHTLRLPTLDGALILGEYIGPDGATIVVGVV